MNTLILLSLLRCIMRKNLYVWQLAGLTFTAVLGTILHFLYDWTDSRFLAAFSAVNESTWEHMKLLFFPMFLFAFLEYFFSNADYESFWQIKLRGILLGLLLIPTLFYTLNGVFGKVPDWVNILTFFIAAGVAYYYETKLFQREPAFLLSTPFSLLILFIIAGLFILFTFFPPHIPLFQDPITKGYSFTP